jgi:hypothetical protein
MVKRSKKTFIWFRFEAKRKDRKRNEKFLEAKQSKNTLYQFRLGRKRKIRSEKKRKKIFIFHVSVRNGSRFASFRFEANKFFLQNRRTLVVCAIPADFTPAGRAKALVLRFSICLYRFFH